MCCAGGKVKFPELHTIPIDGPDCDKVNWYRDLLDLWAEYRLSLKVIGSNII